MFMLHSTDLYMLTGSALGEGKYYQLTVAEHPLEGLTKDIVTGEPEHQVHHP